jgi:peptidoglycan hydrolase-like amidase
MAADCPLELIKAHSVISRSWLLAQRARSSIDSGDTQGARSPNAEGLRWYDQAAHTVFDVCAEDHCQRYHGVDRARAPQVFDAIAATRGQVLTFEDAICDTRYSKCCGGLTEDARTAWGDVEVPYLVSFFDGKESTLSPGPVADKASFQRFLESPPPAYCRCDDADVLDSILPERDRRTTPQFFRWQERLTQRQVRELVRDKLGQDPGPIEDLAPLARGPSGRLWKMRIVGRDRALVIGKELEIRRVLSPTHLLSSAFLVERVGEGRFPEAFVLHGAGWGHGVGLCQIGAAVMAVEGHDYRQILAHYYPGTGITQTYD